jgi:GH24 family phage-related lysozyme (muramidase)
MKLILTTIKDLTPLSLVTYSNKRQEVAIGYNHVIGIYNGQECTQEDAEKWLYNDIVSLKLAVYKYVNVALNRHQERALVSLVHDIGLEEFTKSKLLRHLNNKQFNLASSCFLTYNTNGRAVSVAVLRRRQMEQNIFKLDASVL